MTSLRRLLAAAVAAGLTAALVVCSGSGFESGAGDEAVIRLSWRAVGERIEACREPTAEELAALPPHMRRKEICEGGLTPFQLTVAIDGAPAYEGRIRPGGAHHDRPVYVLREFPVAPGSHRVQVRFSAELPAGVDREPSPPLVLDQIVRLEPRAIALVTLDDAAERLRVVTSEP